jgi:hypothetical protein
VVKDYLGDKITVLFDNGGSKTLALEAVMRSALLEALGE